jgi:hypothetical protein
VLKSVASDNKFEGYLNFPLANAQFKFSTTPAWDGNDYGDDGTSSGHLVHPGSNLQETDAGYYKINVDMTALTYTVVKTTWGLIGDATPGGWSTDSPMAYDTATGLWKAVLNLTAGSLKFRANGAWDINYGDTGADGILDAGGDNIAIPDAGSYTITMKLGFPDYTYSIVKNSFDKRAMFWTAGQSLDINDIGSFTDGYAITKWKNVTSTGAPGSSKSYSDIDFPMFRLADVYLMYAEAVIRSGGDLNTALGYVNALRERAYGDAGGNITTDQLDLAFILDERARELYWEGYRRTDLVRFGQFTNGTYVWPWKGNTKDGIATLPMYNIFPIPSADVSANPNLVQNPGY